jgi:hypothetical protein
VAEDVSGTPEPESGRESSEPAPQLPATSVVVDAEPARPVGGVAVHSRGDRARRSAYRFRFVLFYFGLAVVAGSALGAFVVVLSQPHAKPPPPWSTFVPSGSADARAKQIADHVQNEYKLPAGQPLVAVRAGHPVQTVLTSQTTAAQVDVAAVVVRPDTSKGKHEAGDIKIIAGPDTVAYTLCGLGQNCSIAVGKPSMARHALLRREAVELALYTFKYVPGTSAVVAYLPPPPGQSASGGALPSTSVFLDRKALGASLSQPLIRTIGPRTPTIGTMSTGERAMIDRLTLSHLYNLDYTSSPDGSPLLVLTPLAR